MSGQSATPTPPWGSHHFESYFPDSGQIDMADTDTKIDETTYSELRELASRYPQKRSALLPMLHLVQSVDGRISPRGIEACAEILDITTAQVSGVATFYTMYKRRPGGQHHIGVCTTALCAVMGGDALLASMCAKLGVHPDETTDDGMFSLERIECQAACDYAPVMTVNWEFMDNMDPATADALIDDLAAGVTVKSPRGATITSWREAERVIAGFPDGRADEGPAAGGPSLIGLRIADQNGWRAPESTQPAVTAGQSEPAQTSAPAQRPSADPAATTTGTGQPKAEPHAQAEKAVQGQPTTPEEKVPSGQAGKSSAPGQAEGEQK